MSSTDATVIGGMHLAPADAPAIPDVAIERELGRGGMGAVWLGRQTYLDRQVAVKALTLAGDEAFAARFRREARILAGLHHPHIVACHQAGIAPDGRPFLVMEFVDGPDLKRHVAAQGPLPPAEAARLVADIAEGLRYAHAQGIIHRDVKPENVLLARRTDGGCTAKLADLGLARPAQAPKGSGQDLTAAGQVLGTPATMAPEQFDDPDAVDHRADIYGLGCVLHYALTGEAAFSGHSFAELVASKVHGPAPDPSRRRPGLPRPLADLCMRMLSRDRDARPDYDAIVAGLRSPMATAAPVRRRWLLPVAAAAVVVVAAAVALRPSAPATTPSAAVPAPVAAMVAPAQAPAQAPTSAAAPLLTTAIDLFDPAFERRLRGWNVADPLAWGVSEDVEGFPVAGRAGEIVRRLPGVPGRILGALHVPESATRVLVGVRDADGRTTGLLLLPLNGLIASMVTQGADGADVDSRGSATKSERHVEFTLTIQGGRLGAVIADAATPQPLLIDLPASPVAMVLVAESREPVLFERLRAEP